MGGAGGLRRREWIAAYDDGGSDRPTSWLAGLFWPAHAVCGVSSRWGGRSAIAHGERWLADEKNTKLYKVVSASSRLLGG